MIRILVPLAFSLLVVAACSKEPTPEQKIQKVLDEGVAALERGDTTEAAEHLWDAYSDKAGRDKKTLKRIAFFMMRGQKISFFLRDTKIELAADRKNATVETEIVVGARKAEIESLSDALPTGMRKLPITLRFVLDEGDWKVAAIDGDGLRGEL